MTRLTRLSAAAQAHYVVLRSVPEISLIPFDKNIEKLFQIFSDGSRAYSTDISAFVVFTDQIHLLLTPREKAEDLSRFVQQLLPSRRHPQRLLHGAFHRVLGTGQYAV